MIQIYYGYGKGKTTALLGQGIRAHGAGMKVLLVQFLKDNKSSELSALPYEVFPAPASLPFNPSKADYQGWINSAVDYIKSSDADVLLLDEFIDVIGTFVSESEALEIIAALGGREVVITGHKRVESLFAKADYITHMEKEKHPYDKGVQARRGIEL